MTEHERRPRAGTIEDGLPPLPPSEAGDDERHEAVMARLLARYGPPSIEDYRRTYTTFRLDWPGDDEIRRRHPILARSDPAT